MQLKVALSRVFSNIPMGQPLFLTTAPGNPGRAYVIQQGGQIISFDMDDQARDFKVALTLGSLVRSGGEEGLLGIAFHPDFARNRKVYIQHTAGDRPRRNIVAEYTVSQDGTVFDATTRRVVMEIPQPYGNHNGGMLMFGPDGMLYVGLGDGGAAGDPINAGQRFDTVLGKILRIDVNRRDPEKGYGVPADNPFVNKPGATPEIWAMGLRNPWRFSFDSLTGELWVGDVGQGTFEEIDVVRKGDNMGWNVYEGNKEFRKPKPADEGPFIPPVHQYPRSEGVSVTGGYVYRGKAIPELQGVYIFGDYGSGKIWGLRRVKGKPPQVWLLARSNAITSFAVDPAGEVYVLSHGGSIHRIVPAK